jgi:hypothetical protein
LLPATSGLLLATTGALFGMTMLWEGDAQLIAALIFYTLFRTFLYTYYYVHLYATLGPHFIPVVSLSVR